MPVLNLDSDMSVYFVRSEGVEVFRGPGIFKVGAAVLGGCRGDM